MSDDLTPGMRDTLANMAGRRQATGVAWGPVADVHKSSLYALERRGLVNINRYYQRARLTAKGISLAKAQAAAEVDQ